MYIIMTIDQPYALFFQYRNNSRIAPLYGKRSTSKAKARIYIEIKYLIKLSHTSY